MLHNCIVRSLASNGKCNNPRRVTFARSCIGFLLANATFNNRSSSSFAHLQAPIQWFSCHAWGRPHGTSRRPSASPSGLQFPRPRIWARSPELKPYRAPQGQPLPARPWAHRNLADAVPYPSPPAYRSCPSNQVMLPLVMKLSIQNDLHLYIYQE